MKPKLKVGEKKRQEILGEIINWLYKDVDWELKRKIDTILEHERKVNPLGLWKVGWKKNET